MWLDRLSLCDWNLPVPRVRWSHYRNSCERKISHGETRNQEVGSAQFSSFIALLFKLTEVSLLQFKYLPEMKSQLPSHFSIGSNTCRFSCLQTRYKADLRPGFHEQKWHSTLSNSCYTRQCAFSLLLLRFIAFWFGSKWETENLDGRKWIPQ